MSSQPFLQAAGLAAPVIAGGLIHIAVIKMDAWRALARMPLDGGRRFRGRRIFGDNKSLRGAIVMPLATIACTLLQAALATRFQGARDSGLVDFRIVSPLLWGALLGVGYVLGELPNSFLKRQLDIPPGGTASGAKGVFFWVLDQIDSLVGILLLLCLIRVPPLQVALGLSALTLLIHPAISALMCALRLKSRIG